MTSVMRKIYHLATDGIKYPYYLNITKISLIVIKAILYKKL